MKVKVLSVGTALQDATTEQVCNSVTDKGRAIEATLD